MKHLLALAILGLISACASAPQTKAIVEAREDLPTRTLIENVPFIEQSENYCGPATLTMLAQWSGKKVSIETITPLVYTPGRKGTLQTDMMGAARRLGLLAVRIYGLRNILKEISNQNPVLVFQNLGSTANPIWHYAIALGFDLEQRTMTLHWGKEQNFTFEMPEFERVWKSGDEWAIVVLPPDRIASTATKAELLFAASGLERVGQWQAASTLYQALINKLGPQAAFYFGLGNAEYAMGHLLRAEISMKEALKFDGESGAIWNNLGEIYLKQGRKRAAQTAFSKARSLNTR